MPRRDSLLARWLEPLGSTLWYFFLVWTALVAVVWVGGVRPDDVAGWVRNPGLRSALVFTLVILDPLWFTLAAANVYLSIAEAEGIATARRWAAIVIGVVASILACSAWTGLPLGSALYLRNLGVKLGPVPLALALLWFTVIVGGRELMLRAFRRASHAQIALGTGVVALLTAVNLEPLASRVRLLWSWYARDTHLPISTPVQSYATWLVAGAALAFALRERDVLIGAGKRPLKPVVALALLHIVFLATHLAVRIRG